MKRPFLTYNPKDSSDKNRYPLKKGKVKRATCKRIAKVAGRSMNSFHWQTAYLTIPWNWWGLVPVFSYVFGPVVFKFFIPQYLQKIKVLKRPVKSVDHELDSKIPFKPSYLKCYMDFVNVWVRPLVMLVHRFGIMSGSKLAGEFLRYIKMTYEQAYEVYKVTFTTTKRPESDLKGIKKLHKADPHYCCVPSLHISIVCLCYSFHKMIFERESFTEYEKEKWTKELHSRVIEIAETVLYLKQHSVNCIPAALYMMTRITPELFTPADAVNFINDLFVNSEDIKEEDRKKINSHIQFTYERFLLEGCFQDDWTRPLINWIESYKG